jgi:hypothetical protein
MKQITNARKTSLGAACLVVALAGLAHALPDPPRALDYGPATTLMERGEAVSHAGQASLRRVRATAMPYFSFAQSLRRRG